ncbi:unnamed protein product [Amoebophrya sp. A120]|nr:unnamed protein product [Amoebophrya sp. A120]|eukprot:GSA120T00007514001.1
MIITAEKLEKKLLAKASDAVKNKLAFKPAKFLIYPDPELRWIRADPRVFYHSRGVETRYGMELHNKIPLTDSRQVRDERKLFVEMEDPTEAEMQVEIENANQTDSAWARIRDGRRGCARGSAWGLASLACVPCAGGVGCALGCIGAACECALAAENCGTGTRDLLLRPRRVQRLETARRELRQPQQHGTAAAAPQSRPHNPDGDGNRRRQGAATARDVAQPTNQREAAAFQGVLARFQPALPGNAGFLLQV